MKSNPQVKNVTCRVFLIENEVIPDDNFDDDVFSRIRAYQEAIKKSIDTYKDNYIRFVNFIVDLGGTICLQPKGNYNLDSFYNIYRNPAIIKISEDKIDFIKKYSIVYTVEVI